VKTQTARQRAQAAPQATKSVRCAIYTRKSTEEGLDQAFNSLDAQREAAKAYIASQKHEGWTCLPDRYDDGGYSGGSMDRPALRRLLTDVEAGRVDAVVVYKVDRLSRSLLDFSRIIGSLDEQGVTFVSVTQQFNTTTSMGRLTLNILLSFAQFERETIAERTRDKMSAARRKGKWIGGSPLLGYDLDPNGGRLLVNEAEAVQVRGIFDLYLETESLLETARELNRRGWTAKRWVTRAGPERGGKPFTKGTLFALLTNATYTGEVDFRGTVYPGEHAGIVDAAVWERVQRLLRRNGRAGGQAARNKHGALLSGLLRCGPCDSGMTHTYSQKGERRYRYYVCGHARQHGWETCPTKSIPAGEIERFVVDRIRAIGTDPELQAAVVAQVRGKVREQAERLATERRQIERELRGYADETIRLVGQLPLPNGRQTAATTRQVELQDLTADAEARLAEIARQEAMVAADAGTNDELVAALGRFDPIWDTLSPREQARIVHLLVERVAYDGAKGTIAVTFRPGGIRALTEEEGA
jgi:site-specific DNA recombinase